jgi:hypothetical protein
MIKSHQKPTFVIHLTMSFQTFFQRFFATSPGAVVVVVAMNDDSGVRCDTTGSVGTVRDFPWEDH